jgi:hypothetical protein
MREISREDFEKKVAELSQSLKRQARQGMNDKDLLMLVQSWANDMLDLYHNVYKVSYQMNSEKTMIDMSVVLLMEKDPLKYHLDISTQKVVDAAVK